MGLLGSLEHLIGMGQPQVPSLSRPAQVSPHAALAVQQPAQQNNYNQASNPDLQAPFNPGYTPLQQSTVSGQTPQHGAYNARLQPQRYYDQQQPQRGVWQMNMQYLANPQPDMWQPTFNPSDFNGPVSWNGNAAHTTQHGTNTPPPQLPMGSKVYFDGRTPSMLDKLRSLL